MYVVSVINILYTIIKTSKDTVCTESGRFQWIQVLWPLYWPYPWMGQIITMQPLSSYKIEIFSWNLSNKLNGNYIKPYLLNSKRKPIGVQYHNIGLTICINTTTNFLNNILSQIDSKLATLTIAIYFTNKLSMRITWDTTTLACAVTPNGGICETNITHTMKIVAQSKHI